MNEPLYQLEHLTFAYQGTSWVLNDVSLSIPAGSFTAIIGPNGAGKSTLLRLLSRQIRPERGSFRYRGYPIETYAEDDWARRIAWLPQKPVLPFPLTVYELVRLGCWPRERSWFDRQRVRTWVGQALEWMGITHLIDRSVSSLSGGEQQLAHMARALAQDPETLLLDEPLTFLDFRHIVEVLDRLTEIIHKNGLNVVMVAHDLNMIAHYADWVILLHRGEVIAAGPPVEVLTYTHLKEAYETEVYIDINDLTGKLIILPLPADKRNPRFRPQTGLTPDSR